jgi:crotonobetainyl-CoA:carnitine CoA-transferase CaiB-like acyl-CoA transferase
VLCAIRHRRRTGEGQHIDVSQIEPGIPLTGAAVLDRAVNGRRYRRDDTPGGNRSLIPPAAPHGAYRCRGDDAWVAIAVCDEAQWRRLCQAMGKPPWTEREALANRDSLDREIEAWTRELDRYEVMRRLQAAGVPCGVVQNARDRFERDEQLRARGYFQRLPNGATGEWHTEQLPYRMSATPPSVGGRIARGAPSIGEDDVEVYSRLLGLRAEEIQRGEAEGLFR